MFIRISPPGDVGNAWPPRIPGTARSFAEEMANRNKRNVKILRSIGVSSDRINDLESKGTLG